MTIAVLLKAVPELEELVVDPATKSVRRDAGPLLTNPCDARALTAALRVRRPGESVTALSLGPPGARTVLGEALDLGADRAVHLTDPAFAGSDVLVTSDLLARALQRLGPDLVLTGRSTTDSETGLVGPEIAARLGWPHAGPARSLAAGDGPSLEVVADTEVGTATFRLERPALVAVGEKIGKPGKVPPEGRALAEGRPLEIWDAAALGVAPASVGHAGSPTVVEEVVPDAPTRSNVRVASGSPSEKVRSALEHLAPLLARPPLGRSRPIAPSGPSAGAGLVLVTEENGALAEDALPLLSELRRMGLSATAIWVGTGPAGADLARIARAGAERTWVDPAPPGWSEPSVVARRIDRLLAVPPAAEAVLFLSTEHGRSVAAALAARRGLGVVADAVRVEAVGRDRRWEKPAFGRSSLARIRCRTRPEVVTVRPGAFEPLVLANPPTLRTTRLEAAPDPPRVARVAVGFRRDPSWGRLETARVVLVVGMGLGGPERLPELAPALAAWGAALGGTRRAVDAGWLPPALQVGLTGQSVAPDLAVLLGVRGSGHHLIGLRRARALLAINTDPAAPALAQADVGIVGDWAELLPDLVPALGAVLADRRR